jgi:glycosyltransferase involved in cell wall biosynthesis
MMEKISILMPVYNAALYVESSIKAILAQSYQNFELLICDDCSTDNTVDVLNNFNDDRIKISHNAKNKGYLLTCNALAEMAVGEYITFQDADDLASENRLSILLLALQKNDLDLVGSNVNYISEQGKVIGRSFYPKRVDVNYLSNELMPFCGSSILCKKAVYQEIGLYDLAYDRMGAEDYDWVYRASIMFTLGNVEQPLYSYRMHASSVSNVTSLTLSTQLFSEHIAKKLFITRMNNTSQVETSVFITEQQKLWEVYLKTDETPLLLKKSSINSLLGQHFSNFKILWELTFCNAPMRKKIRSILLLSLDLCLGYTRVFKLKTFYKKHIKNNNQVA